MRSPGNSAGAVDGRAPGVLDARGLDIVRLDRRDALTAALLLRDSGHDVIVYERSAAELEQRGAGIGFLPASSRYLAERAAWATARSEKAM